MATAAKDLVIHQELLQVAPDDLCPYPGVNPRRRFDHAAQEQLNESLVAQGGNIEPGVITDGPDEQGVGPKYWLVTGERRWRGCRTNGLRFNAVYRPGLTFAQAVELAGIENLHRADLTAIEEAIWYQKMEDEAGKTRAEIAKIRGVDESTVSNTLRLLQLPEAVQQLIEDGKIAATNARDFLLPWMKEAEEVRDRFFRIVIQQLEFGAQMGQSMSKPWVKEMVERVGTIAKPTSPTAAPKPEPKKARPAPSSAKPAAATKPAELKAPPAEESAPAPEETPAAASPDEAPTDAQPTAAETAEPAVQEPTPTEPGPAPTPDPATGPAAATLDQGVFASLAQALGGDVHHVTLTIFPHPSGGGRYHVTILPKSQAGMASATGEVANGTAEELDEEVRAAAARFLKKINELA
jgi:ParB/RepB/Spo0J family partition protein